MDATLRQLLGSFRRETGRASPLRLRIRRVAHATTLAALITTGCAPSGQEADLVALNGIALDAPIEATRRVKCIAR
ncbi:MAG: hypothetical protein GXP55_21580 [Deltaproteobacteria bacterium]|nr:hypothetical protein [Deltaproteobacteria bacterium]